MAGAQAQRQLVTCGVPATVSVRWLMLTEAGTWAACAPAATAPVNRPAASAAPVIQRRVPPKPPSAADDLLDTFITSSPGWRVVGI